MTITYSLDVSSSTFLGIHRLLLRWKGSIWKSTWPELVCWLAAYFGLSFCYRCLMDKQQQIYFEDLCIFFNTYSDYIPITFMLGFYVSAVFTRWGEIFMNLGWIDSPAILIATIVRGTTEEARNIRRNIIRYLVLVQAMVYRDISACVKKRFPTMDHLVTAGIMTPNELKEFDAIETEHIKYWTPIQWAFLLLRKARDKGLIDSDFIYVDMLEKIRQYRVNVLTLTLYDWVPIPLVYTQVVNLAVRAYFLVALMGRQYLNNERNLPGKTNIDLYFPVMTILQFLFYMGWIKVAEVMLNPFGEDDEDFETNWIIDRNLQVGLCIVDDCYGRVPNLERDQFWEQSNPQLLYTKESAGRHQHPMMGSCNDSNQQEDALLLHPPKRRLMSTVAGPEMGFGGGHSNPAFAGDEEKGEIGENGDDGIVPVFNHNPGRRISVVHNAYADGGPSRLLDTVRRKFSRTSTIRRGSNEPEHRFDRTHHSRASIQSVQSNASVGEGSVQTFLWGGKTKLSRGEEKTKEQSDTHANNAANDLNGHHLDQSHQKIVKNSLPAIQEEEMSENGGSSRQGDNLNKNSASSTSLDTVSSTSGSSAATGGNGEGGEANQGEEGSGNGH